MALVAVDFAAPGSVQSPYRPLRRLLEEAERVHVDNARDQGWPWQSIATALNVTRQSVQEKHASRHKATGKEE